MTPGIVLCSRVHSRRLPRKPLIEFMEKPAIRILCERLLSGPYPVCLSTPSDHEDDILHEATAGLPIKRFRGHRSNVLARFYWAAKEHGFDPVIRVTHDDLFVDLQMMKSMVEKHINEKADYTFVSKCLRGADCEVVSLAHVERCLKLHGDREGEFLSYSFRRDELSPKIVEYIPEQEAQVMGNLVMDWPEDVRAIRLVIQAVGRQHDNASLYNFLRHCPAVFDINRQPKVSVYTCAYNAQDTIVRTMLSVQRLNFDSYEYIAYDDGSTDRTAGLMLHHANSKPTRVMGNSDNVGLASACNAALRDARGEYILRLDADDELLPYALNILVPIMDADKALGAVYPAYCRDGRIVPNRAKHMGGAIVRRRVYEEVRFCDGIRHYEGAEFYRRLRGRFAAGECEEPTWRYHATSGSLSSNDTLERREAKQFVGPP